MERFVNVTQELTQAMAGPVKFGVAGFNIVIGLIVDSVVPH